MAAGYSKAQVISLYRQLLKGVKTFPSIRREGLYQTIREEFRDNKGLQEPAQIKAAMQLGISNLQKMGAFGNMDKSSMHWSLDLDKDPLGQAAYQERQAALEGGKEARKEEDSAASSAYGGRR